MLRATHLAPSVLVTAIATALAASAGRAAPGTAAVAGAVLAGQFSVGWANDWLDVGRDAALHRNEKPIVAGEVSTAQIRSAALVALAACAALSLASGVLAAVVHLVAVGFGWAYNLGLKRTALSVAPYAVAFGLLPVFVTLGLPGRPLPPWWAVAGGALLGAGAHFTNALPDLTGDARTGVRGLPQRVGAKGSLIAGAVLLAAGAGVFLPRAAGGVVLVAGILGVVALTVAIVVTGWTGRDRLPWLLTLGIAGVAVTAFVASGGALS